MFAITGCIKFFASLIVLRSAGGQNRTDIKGFSDLRRDQLGYPGDLAYSYLLKGY